MHANRWPRILLWAGIVGLLVGLADPLEGSLVIVPAVGVLALGAHLAHSRYRRPLDLAFALVIIGVAALWGISAVGGFGGSTGRSNWWALIFVPYAVGWIVALFAGIRAVRALRGGWGGGGEPPRDGLVA